VHVSDGDLVSVRWRRYGKDRLYVTSADVSAVGWHDLVDDVAHPERLELADQLAAAVVAWRGADVAPDAPRAVEVPPTPEVPPAAAEPEPNPLPEPEPEWQDLAELAPGAQARKQATALREAAPVKTFQRPVLWTRRKNRKRLRLVRTGEGA